jgi:hypothetical protein
MVSGDRTKGAHRIREVDHDVRPVHLKVAEPRFFDEVRQHVHIQSVYAIGLSICERKDSGRGETHVI